MALAWHVDQPDNLAKVFASRDEYLAIFCYFINGKKIPKSPLTPEDDFYPAPFCFMPKKEQSNGGFLVFTMQVPWLDGTWLNVNQEENDNRYRPQPTESQQGSAHYKAKEWMEGKGSFGPPIIGTVEEFQELLGLKEQGIFTFTRDGCYPTKEEISLALEDRAVAVTCAALGWKIPQSWRLNRKKAESLHGIPMFDLAAWDQQRHNQTNNDSSNDNDEANNAYDVQIQNGRGHCGGREEEKKDSTEYQC